MEKITTRWDLPPGAVRRATIAARKFRRAIGEAHIAEMQAHVYQPLPPDDIRATGKLPESAKRPRPENPELHGQPRKREIA